MDPREAQEQLENARAAYRDAVLPRLPTHIVVTCSVLTGAAVALSGQYSPNGVIRSLFLVGAVALAAASAGLFFWSRRRRGLTGLRGSARDSLGAHLISAAAMFVAAVSATAEMRWFYVGLGIALGIAVAVMLRRWR
ncbi:hypothetical protein [Nocardia sp. NPDC051570]|uniref:hypothetical protein n=1 Tax=Nocardia sp. NPDC051570 TaxID=3364324 RepID=UPI0037B416BA